MLHNVYIFREDGMCLFARKYGGLETDEILVSGFLSAISLFGKQIGTESLKRLDFGDYRIVLVNNGENLITAGVIDSDEDVNAIETDLKRLTYDFKSYYENIKDTADDRDLFLSFSKHADDILMHVPFPEKISTRTTDLPLATKQLRDKFASVLEVIASGKPLIICSESREKTELYVHTLAKLRIQTNSVPWTEDEETIFSLKKRNYIVVGVPLRYVMKLAEDEELTILNLSQFRVHGHVKIAKKWKDVANYASEHIEELGEEGIYSYIQAQMEN